MRRSRAREIALQVLYQDDLNPRHNPADSDAFIDVRIKQPELREFTRSLVSGVRRNRPELDAMLEKTAANWRLARMAATDRNVLRLGAFELLFTELPAPIAIDEALELAKRFGSAQSSQFVNGILDKLLQMRSTPPGEPKA